jgi:hypothetical protein
MRRFVVTVKWRAAPVLPWAYVRSGSSPGSGVYGYLSPEWGKVQVSERNVGVWCV